MSYLHLMFFFSNPVARILIEIPATAALLFLSSIASELHSYDALSGGSLSVRTRGLNKRPRLIYWRIYFLIFEYHDTPNQRQFQCRSVCAVGAPRLLAMATRKEGISWLRGNHSAGWTVRLGKAITTLGNRRAEPCHQ
ncbi:uncharacterized protein PV07_10847 [Cladophialophora immunda]|uniref:Uncharacterized protein n=1 Tax=Cladophialophora immunda TaxID=569365 RepID=A0A0D2CGC4_9EURO|nr:uncharacterized protein PV07_10847 [Cladophialophora immunda]KIW22559.1 hypothetical protein PV07_10847 [Cladophialophora immunda]